MKARIVAVGVCLLALSAAAGPSSAAWQRQAPAPRATLTAHAGVIVGVVRDGTERPVAAARLRLRDLTSGRILMTGRSDHEGGFRFTGVPSGSYVVELVDENGTVRALSGTCSMSSGQAASTFIRLGAQPPWYSGFFTNAAMAAVSSAAGLGVTAVGNGFQPASGRF
ncbi:MAG TPA: carboxypeptidase-like regulatory domain-containing protein [Vicinamibacterales bacterium]|jgi:hypothetical protein|nr:carboxypeptidase-like regulatory domain-containing protein [Vicinamibacterales bacterium]